MLETLLDRSRLRSGAQDTGSKDDEVESEKPERTIGETRKKASKSGSSYLRPKGTIKGTPSRKNDYTQSTYTTYIRRTDMMASSQATVATDIRATRTYIMRLRIAYLKSS